MRDLDNSKSLMKSFECLTREGFGENVGNHLISRNVLYITNFIRPYLHQFFIDSHSLNGDGKPLKRPFNRYQSCLEAISIGRDIRQINW